LIKLVECKNWVVHSTNPTMDTNIIENYLGRYINRVAVSKKRLQYIKKSSTVSLIYNDYKNQKEGQPAPKKYKIMDPMEAINQILQHVLPPYFQKSRRYGLHHSASKIKAKVDDALKRNGHVVRTVFEIITHLSQLTPYECEKCGSQNYTVEPIEPDKEYIKTSIKTPSPQRPPPYNPNIKAA